MEIILKNKLEIFFVGKILSILNSPNLWTDPRINLKVKYARTKKKKKKMMN